MREEIIKGNLTEEQEYERNEFIMKKYADYSKEELKEKRKKIDSQVRANRKKGIATDRYKYNYEIQKL